MICTSKKTLEINTRGCKEAVLNGHTPFGGKTHGYALYMDRTAVCTNTVATVSYLLSHGVTAGCDTFHLSYAFRFSLGHFSGGYWAGAEGTDTHQHPSMLTLVVSLLRELHCSLGANTGGAARSNSRLSQQ